MPPFVARGAETVNNYFVVSRDIWTHPSSCEVWSDYVPVGSHEDHLPLLFRVEIPVSSRPPSSLGSGGYARWDTQDVDRMSHFAALVASLPVIPWSLEPSSHLHLLQRQLRSAACVAFPRGPRRKMRGSLSDEAYDCLVRKARVVSLRRSMVRNARAARNRDILVAVMAGWRGLQEGCAAMLLDISSATRNLILSVHFLDTAVAAATSALASCLQKDSKTFLQRIADRLGRAASSGSVSGLFSILRPLYRKVAPRARSVFDCEGRATTTRRETSLAFASHFSTMLDAERLDLQDIARRVCVPLEECVMRAAGTMDWATVPSVSQLA